MNFDLLKSTVYLTIHGSQAYGMATDSSDFDCKGFCIPPEEIENDLFHTFEQAENHLDIEERFKSLKNPKNPKFESVVYSFKKFIKLAAAANPNILEILFVDDKDVLMKHPVVDLLLGNRDIFLSSKCHFTTTGYAYAQLYKIQRHRKWITKGNLKQPIREDFGLKSESLREFEEVFRYIQKQVQHWTFSQFPLDELQRSSLQEEIWEVIYNVSAKTVNWDNWQVAYENASIQKLKEGLGLKDDIIELIKKEESYRVAKKEYDSFLNWQKNRNPVRKAMEEKFGLDGKHASQLIRLLRMGYEIITTGKVNVKRPDAQELLEIKNGSWSYEKVLDYANNMQEKMNAAYKVTKLPRSVDYVKINNLYQNILCKYRDNDIINYGAEKIQDLMRINRAIDNPE